MDKTIRTTMTLRLELFVREIAAARDFYTRVLGFTAGGDAGDDYTPLHNGAVVLSLNRRAALPPDHPIHVSQGERPGRGIEIVLEVDDLDAHYARVREQGWPIASPLQRQPWGLTDFRVIDPDGYYLRLTNRPGD